MTSAIGRSGGRVVGLLVALLTARSPVRLTAQSAGTLLAVLPGSARAAGMGGAGAAIVGDAGAIFANPAALATIHHLAVEGSYESFPSGSTLSIGALALRVNRFTWGAGAAAFGPSYTSADLLGVSTLVFRTGLERRNAERSEEHTSELQSRLHLVCRLLLEKKKTKDIFGT